MGLNLLMQGAGVFGAGAAGYFGQKETNETNYEIAQMTNAMNAQQAQQNRDFQEYMSNSAHRRQMKDLKAAGLNPLLAAGQSGASTPSGATAQMEAPRMENEIAPAMSSALAMQSAVQGVKKQNAEIGLMDEEKKLKKAQTGKTIVDAQVSAGDLPGSKAKQGVWDWLQKAWKDARQTNAAQQRTPRAADKAVQWHKQFEQKRINQKFKRGQERSEFLP